MKLKPYPHQVAGAEHLASKKVAGLFDDPRVGKNLATVMACDKLGIKNILFISTASGRAVAAQAFRDNQTVHRTIQIPKIRDKLTGDLVIVSWDGINSPALRAKLLAQMWQVIVADESHKAKSFTAKRTRALYGQPQLDGRGLDQRQSLVARAERVWLLSGTPIPHDLSDLYPALRTLAPEVLLAHNGMPDVTTMSAFDARYTIRKPHKISPWRTIMVKIGGQNEAELRQRLQRNKFMLRRTQAQVGILPARYALRPIISEEFDPVIEQGMDRDEIIEILESRRDHKNLAALLHVHGQLKAHSVVDAVNEEFDCGLDKIVLGYWHRSVGEILAGGLAAHGVVGINGETPFAAREQLVYQFSTKGGSKKVFLQQIGAAGESIDLSASSLLWFVESVFSPAMMKQAAERVTNLNNAKAPVVETCFIQGSIDEVIQGRLLALWSAINKVISH